MCAWSQLEAELDSWAETGRAASFWWRDDDAVAMTPPLRRLFDIASGNDAAVAVAVVPADAESDLFEERSWPRRASALQHGLAHRNHAPTGEKKSEFGPHRPVEAMLDDIRAGAAHLVDFSRFFAAFVPPWNRISPEVVSRLPTLGHRGVSTHGPRRNRYPVDGLVQSNTHVDPVNWRGGRGYVGDSAALGQVLRHLEARRTGTVDRDEPTGLLTHHLVHDNACWRFIERLAAVITGHAGAEWLTVEEVFAA